MYLSFYKLKSEPFQEIIDPKHVWFSDMTRKALVNFKNIIAKDEGLLLLTGDIGSGKSAFTKLLISSLGDAIIAGVVEEPSVDLLKFQKDIATAFENDRDITSRKDFLAFFSQFLTIKAAEGKKVLLVIEKAHELNQTLLKEILFLSDLEVQGQKNLIILLVEQNEYSTGLLQSDTSGIRGQISLSHNIDVLTKAETALYIQHHLKLAGTDQALFSQDAVSEIHSFSGGSPNLINIVCDLALLDGFVAEEPHISKKIIKDCINTLLSSQNGQQPLPVPELQKEKLQPSEEMTQVLQPIEETQLLQPENEGLAKEESQANNQYKEVPIHIEEMEEYTLAPRGKRRRKKSSFLTPSYVILLIGILVFIAAGVSYFFPETGEMLRSLRTEQTPQDTDVETIEQVVQEEIPTTDVSEPVLTMDTPKEKDPEPLATVVEEPSVPPPIAITTEILPEKIKIEESKAVSMVESIAEDLTQINGIRTIQVPFGNLRSGPSMDAEVIGTVQKGEKAAVLNNKFDWFYVKFDDERVGWIYESLFEESADSPSSVGPVTDLPEITSQIKEESLGQPTASEQQEILQKKIEILQQKVIDQPETVSEEAIAKKSVPSQFKTVQVSFGNLRDGPSSEAAVIGTVQKGDKVSVLNSKFDWHFVKLDDDRLGWVYETLFMEEASPEAAEKTINESSFEVPALSTTADEIKEKNVESTTTGGNIYIDSPPEPQVEPIDTRLPETPVQNETNIYTKVGDESSLDSSKLEPLQPEAVTAEPDLQPDKTKIADLDPQFQSPSYWIQKSYDSLTSGRYSVAVDAATKAIALDPTLVKPYVNRAWAYSEMGLYNQAIEDGNAALARAPENPMAYNNRGLAYHRKGDFEAAREDYKKACELQLSVGCENHSAISKAISLGSHTTGRTSSSN